MKTTKPISPQAWVGEQAEFFSCVGRSPVPVIVAVEIVRRCTFSFKTANYCYFYVLLVANTDFFGGRRKSV